MNGNPTQGSNGHVIELLDGSVFEAKIKHISNTGHTDYITAYSARGKHGTQQYAVSYERWME